MRVNRSFERAAKTMLVVEIRSLQGRLFEEGRDKCYGRSMTKRPGIRSFSVGEGLLVESLLALLDV